MTACGMIPFPLRADPFHRPFRECWLEITDRVRNTPVLKGCASCENRELCNPCVAMIYGETGTVDQKSEYMCRLAGSVRDLINQELEGISNE